MVQFLAVVFGIILVSVGFQPAMAQVYNDKAQEVKAPLENAIEKANTMYANEAIAGAGEDIKSQDVRYREMTVPLNEANEHHFDMLRNEVK